VIVVALAGDLMDQSKLRGALPDIRFVRTGLACAGAEVVIVDLDRFGPEIGAARVAAPTARIVAYGPHADREGAAAAVEAGADRVVARSLLFRDPAAVVTDA